MFDYKEYGKRVIYTLFDPLIRIFAAIGLRPNHITFIGFLFNVLVAGILIYTGYINKKDYGDGLIVFGIGLVVASVFDSIDGRFSRLYGLESKFGAYIDSVLDRYSEFIIFIGLVLYAYAFSEIYLLIGCLFAMMGSILVSYNRSRAETIGVRCDVGLMQRPERIVFISVWCIVFGIIRQWDPFVMRHFYLGFVILSVLTHVTAVRRILVVHQELKKK